MELNADYFRDGVGDLKAAEDSLDTPTLFDILDGEENGDEGTDTTEADRAGTESA